MDVVTYFWVHFCETRDRVYEVWETDAITDPEDFLRLFNRIMEL